MSYNGCKLADPLLVLHKDVKYWTGQTRYTPLVEVNQAIISLVVLDKCQSGGIPERASLESRTNYTAEVLVKLSPGKRTVIYPG